jgi:hypothetical protein
MKFKKYDICRDKHNNDIHIVVDPKEIGNELCGEPYITTYQINGEFKDSYRSCPVSRLKFIGRDMDTAMVEML